MAENWREEVRLYKEQRGKELYEQLIRGEIDEDYISLSTYIYRVLACSDYYFLTQTHYDYCNGIQIYIFNSIPLSLYGSNRCDYKIHISYGGITMFEITFTRYRAGGINYKINSDNYNIQKYFDKDEFLSNMKVKTKALPNYMLEKEKQKQFSTEYTVEEKDDIKKTKKHLKKNSFVKKLVRKPNKKDQ